MFDAKELDLCCKFYRIVGSICVFYSTGFQGRTWGVKGKKSYTWKKTWWWDAKVQKKFIKRNFKNGIRIGKKSTSIVSSG